MNFKNLIILVVSLILWSCSGNEQNDNPIESDATIIEEEIVVEEELAEV